MTDRVRVIHPEGGRLMTKQAPAAEQDINTIMGRWIAHGVPPRAGAGQPRYGDFSSGQDFQTSLNQIREAEQQFQELPANVRQYCRNDPGEFLDLVMDPERRDELVRLGLLEERVPESAPPKPAPPATDPGTGSTPAPGGDSAS